MARLTAELERTIYAQSVRPIIVKTSRVLDLWAEIIPYLPTGLMGTNLLGLFPRITGAAEAALASPKMIPFFNMLSFPATPRFIEELAQDTRVEKIYPDRMMYAIQKIPDEGVYVDQSLKTNFTTTFWTKKMLGVDEANIEGWTGKGVKVAIIDTGVGLHQQLSFVERLTAMTGLYTDGVGHGTYVATILAGRDAKDPFFNVPVIGMAPDVKLISIKSLGYIIGIGKESDVLKAMEMVTKLGVNIVNFSLGAGSVAPGDDPQIEAIRKLTQENKMICVVAAGNSGPNPNTITSPGVAPEALTVGGLDEMTGEIAGFSSRGPSSEGGVKPDVIAPAVRIDSGTINFLDVSSDKKPQRFSYISGTSTASPHVAGLLACARQMFAASGIELDTPLIKEICATYSEREQSNNDGYGMIEWDWFRQYISA